MSIFTDENYVKTYLIYCDHCLDIIWKNKEVSYYCDQCFDFNVCEKCIQLMSTHHETQHKFNNNPQIHTTGKHFGVTCSGCKEENLSGMRFICTQCEPSYDLCSKCFQKSEIIHNKSHVFQYDPDPLVFCNNRKLLAQRTLAFFRCQKITSNDQRDPFTEWTKTDAEKILQCEEEILRCYQQEQKQITGIQL